MRWNSPFRYFLVVAILIQITMGCLPSSRNPDASMNISILIIPIGDLNPEDLEYLRDELKAKFGDCIIGDKTQMWSGAYNPQREQYLSGVVLQRLSELHSNIATEVKVLGVTEEDLYSTGLNFVFGQAQLSGQYAIISLKRLDPAFYGMVPNKGIFRHRMVKEAVHELGHTLGFQHCPNKYCVMHFSNSLWDTDVKEDSFCKWCLARIKRP